MIRFKINGKTAEAVIVFRFREKKFLFEKAWRLGLDGWAEWMDGWRRYE
jgi:hypothetical protein